MKRIRLYCLACTTLCFGFSTDVLKADELLPVNQDIAAAIDFYVDARLATGDISPAARATDTTLLRRAMLDLVGRIPTAAEARQYLASTEENKLEKIVDHLLADQAFIRHTASELNTLLSDDRNEDLRPYLLESLASNKGWDQMFREMISGDTRQPSNQGPTSFVLKRVNDLDKLTNVTSAVFFGINISCAKCHDHPLVSEWKQSHFFGMKSFFSRSFGNGDFLGEREYGAVQFKTTSGETLDAKMMFLDGLTVGEPEWKAPDSKQQTARKKQLEQLKKDKKPVPLPNFSRREQLVKVALESDQHSYLARSIVNRTWYRLLGIGLVMPLDQMHPENPSSHPELLDWLARDFVSHGYDLKRLVRGIVLSHTYRRTSRWAGDGERPPGSWFAVANVRTLTPRQYATSLRIASRSAEFWTSENPEEIQKRIVAEENSAQGLAGKFEQPGEDFQVSTTEALMFNNNADIQNQLLADDGSMLVGQLKLQENNSLLATEAAWNILVRPLVEEEQRWMVKYLEDRKDRRIPAIQQLVWALLTSGEFRFNY
jgi:hypothetical protein